MRSHYALLCESHHDITVPVDLGVIDANRARNFASLNPLGASQVTAVVRYQSSCNDFPVKHYPVSFRATLHGLGFVRLASPVVLEGDIAVFYRQVCKSETVEEWTERTEHLRQQADETIFQQFLYNPLDEERVQKVGHYELALTSKMPTMLTL
jgi:hypothetical protein